MIASPATTLRRRGTSDFRTVLGANGSTGKAELYSRIGLKMTYRPGMETLKGGIVSSDLRFVLNMCPRTNTGDAHTVLAVRALAIAT